MKWLSLSALLIALLWQSSVDYRFVIGSVVTIGAIAVITQAAQQRKHIWVGLFVLVATLFNPVLTGTLPYELRLWTDVACLAAFAASLVVLKNKPTLSIVSITDRTPGSESL
jgi:hypothetical protein